MKLKASLAPLAANEQPMKRSCLHPTAVFVLLFAGAIALGTLLLLLPASSSAPTPALTALFTATSAVCVTGLAVVDTGTHWTLFGQGVILALIQLGGFGMMTAASLLAMLVNAPLRTRSRQLLQAETRALALGDVRQRRQARAGRDAGGRGNGNPGARRPLRARSRHGLAGSVVAGPVPCRLGLQQRRLFDLRPTA